MQPNDSVIVIAAAILGWLGAQATKGIVVSLRDKRLNKLAFVRSGGMPSSHSALMVALTTTVAYVAGVSSVEFAMLVVLTAVIMYDATGVRRTTGEQTDAIELLAQKVDKRVQIQHPSRGHSVFQVVMGSAIGAIAAVVTVVIL